MKAITFIVGLPGSGKTFLVRQLQLEIPGLFVIDDPLTPDDLDWDEMSRRDHIAIADVNLCNGATRKLASTKILSKWPDCTIEWIFFENDPEQCRRNIILRNDGRYVDPTIDRFSKIYQPPEDIRPISVYRPQE